MANLKEVRARISSVNNTQQITKAMKLVSASKLKRAQDRIMQMRPYADKLFEMLANILDSVDTGDLSLDFSKEREVKNVLVVLMTSDKGLCGSFNSTLIKTTRKMVEEKYATQVASGNFTLATIGKKGNDFFKKEELSVNADYIDTFQKLNFDTSGEITDYIMNGFLEEKFDVVEVVYAQFKNAATQYYQAEQFLPIKKLETAESGEETTTKPDYIFEPDKTELIEVLVPKILKTQFFRYLLDSNASEHGSRMVAMDKATENANELLKDLKLAYNKERQAAITNEILEIVGGAAALEQG